MSDGPASFDPLRDRERARAATSAASAAPGPVFVSRGATSRKRANETQLDADGVALPSLRDARVRWMIALVLVLQAYAWSRVSGYQLADSVEFMERASIFERGQQMIDSGAIRPFGFSFLFVPFFALADWFGIHDQRAVVWCVIVFQMLIGCVLAWRCMRIGAIVAGRAGSVAAGLFVACSPVFLQYSTQPVSDIAAGVCIAFALEGMLERASFRRSLIAGLWLGLAFIIAFKTLLLTICLLVATLLRDRWQHSSTWRGLTLGAAIGILLQSTFDWMMYGTFGVSVTNYVAQNAGSVAASVPLKIFNLTGWKWALHLAAWVYGVRSNLTGDQPPSAGDTTIHGLKSSWYYLKEAHLFVVWPALVLVGTGVLHALRRPGWKSWLLIGSVITSAIVLSNKGEKDFRLWLPMLPLLAPLAASGWVWMSSAIAALSRSLRPLVATLGALVVIGFALHELTRINVRHYEGYWAAIDWVDTRARDSLPERRERAKITGSLGEPQPLRVGSAYNWAVFLRNSPLIEVVKLPWQLNMWKQYKPNAQGHVAEWTDDMDAIAELDVLIVHLPILKENPELMAWVSAHFELATALYDQRTYDDIGPLFVLERRTGSSRARTFFDVASGAADDSIPLGGTTRRRMDFVGADGERLQLLDVSFETLPPQNFGWITYRWRALTPLHHDWWVIDRITSPDETNVWQNNHALAYGCEPTSSWVPGEVHSESYLVVPAADAFLPQGPVRPIGGGYRRGDLIPTRTWMRVQAFEPASLETGKKPVVMAELQAARPGETEPIRDEGREQLLETHDGIQFSGDGFVRVAGFFVPVLAPWRVPDDGRPMPP